MKLLRFITDEEHATLKELSKREELVSDNKGNYYHAESHYANSPLKDDKDVEYINTLLKEVLQGFVSFSNFVEGNTNRIRIQYNWCADDDHKGGLESFTGVGWITIDELRDGF